MIYSAYKLNKQGDNIQPWHTLFPICNQSVVPCPVLLFLDLHTDFSGSRWGVCYSHPLKNFPQFIVIRTVKGFCIVNKAEVDVFLELFCFFNDPEDVGDLIFGSSAFSKSNLNIWKFTVHVLLKPGLENFEHFSSVWDECNCAVVWTSLALPFFGIRMKTDLFQSCGHCWVSQIYWHIECSTFTASSSRI